MEEREGCPPHRISPVTGTGTYRTVQNGLGTSIYFTKISFTIAVLKSYCNKIVIPMTSVNVIFLLNHADPNQKLSRPVIFCNMAGSQNYFSIKIFILKNRSGCKRVDKIIFHLKQLKFNFYQIHATPHFCNS